MAKRKNKTNLEKTRDEEQVSERELAQRIEAERDDLSAWEFVKVEVAPSPKTIKLALTSETQRQWGGFVKRYRAEMASAENSRVLDVLAALSHEANFSVGCYCEEESRCHRSVLRQLLLDRGAKVV